MILGGVPLLLKTKNDFFVSDLTEYTEVDPPNFITSIATNSVTFTNLGRDSGAYLYYDFGVDAFSGEYEIWFTANISTTTGLSQVNLVLSQDLEDSWAIQNGIIVGFNGGDTQASVTRRISAQQRDGGTQYYTRAGSYSDGTTYYCSFRKTSTNVEIHLATSASNRDSETWASSVVQALNSDENYRYFLAVSSEDRGFTDGRDISGTFSDFSFQEL